MLFRFLLALAMLQRLVAAPATAQPWDRTFEGSGTYGDTSNCARRSYNYAEQARAVVFRDQDGKVNVKINVERRFGGIATQVSQSGEIQRSSPGGALKAGPNTILVRTKTLGPSFDLVRCPSYGAPLPVAAENDAAASLAFVQQFFTTWNSDDQTALGFAANHYLPEVVFYGRSAARNTIMQQKYSFVRRWPIRSYVIVPGSVSTRCGSDGCEITVSVDWTCRSIERGAESSGVSTFTLQLVGQGAGTMIAMENGAVISRRSLGPPGNSPPPATWTPPLPIQPERPALPAMPQIDVPPPRR